MLRKEVNDLLTQTGSGTPMGAMFRQYWMPALHAEELPENDCPPVRVKLLSERLIAFRDSAGKMGLIDEFCAHRGVSLWFGRNEEHGLRCQDCERRDQRIPEDMPKKKLAVEQATRSGRSSPSAGSSSVGFKVTAQPVFRGLHSVFLVLGQNRRG